MQAILYARFSPRPDDRCESILHQMTTLADYCDKAGLFVKLACWDVQAKGGGRGDELDPREEFTARKGLQLALAHLQKGDRLVVTKRDRLSRSVYPAEFIRRQVLRKGASIASLQGLNGTTPMEIACQQMAYTFAELERAMIRERTREGLLALRKRGFTTCRNQPYGFTCQPDPQGSLAKSGRLRHILVPHPVEQLVIGLVLALRARRIGPVRTARILNAIGWRQRNGAEWEVTSLVRIREKCERDGVTGTPPSEEFMDSLDLPAPHKRFGAPYLASTAAKSAVTIAARYGPGGWRRPPAHGRVVHAPIADSNLLEK